MHAQPPNLQPAEPPDRGPSPFGWYTLAAVVAAVLAAWLSGGGR